MRTYGHQQPVSMRLTGLWSVYSPVTITEDCRFRKEQNLGTTRPEGNLT